MAFDWKSVISAVAPTVATALLGPGAGLVVNMATKLLLGKEASKEELLKHIESNQNPEVMLKLRELEAQVQQFEKNMGFKFADLEVEDRKSARAREVAGGLFSSIMLHALAFTVLIGFLAMALWVFTGELPKDPTRLTIVGAVIGYLSSKADVVVSYFFGSSAGSQAKSDALSSALGRMAK